MIYLIDDSAVGTRTDWRQMLQPVDQPRREESFPGISEKFVVDGAPEPDTLLITGKLEGSGASVAAARVALLQTIRTYIAMRSDQETHVVKIDGLAFNDCKLWQFNMTGELTHARTDGETITVMQPCRFLWRQLVDSVEVAE